MASVVYQPPRGCVKPLLWCGNFSKLMPTQDFPNVANIAPGAPFSPKKLATNRQHVTTNTSSMTQRLSQTQKGPVGFQRGLIRKREGRRFLKWWLGAMELLSVSRFACVFDVCCYIEAAHARFLKCTFRQRTTTLHQHNHPAYRY